MNRATSEWRWGVSETTSRWYDSVKILRQDKLYDWKPVIVKSIVELHKQFNFSDRVLAKLEAYYLLRKDLEYAKAIHALR
jgi:hypothetical protein